MAASIKKIVQNSILIGFGLILGNLSSFVFRLLIARSYGPSSFGVFSIGFMVVSVATTITVFGLPAGVTHYVSIYRSSGKPKKITQVVGISLFFCLIIGFILAAILFIIADPLSTKIFNSPNSARFIKLFAVQVPANGIILLTAAFVLGYERGGLQVLTKEVTPKVLILISALLVISSGGSVFDVGLGYVIAKWIAALIGFLIILAVLSSSKSPIVSVPNGFNEAKELFIYSSPLFFTTFTGFFLNWIDTFSVAYYLSDAQVGIYQTAFILGSAIGLFSSAISESLFPNFSALIGEGKESMIVQRYANGVRWSVIMTTAPLFYLLAFADTSLSLLFGPEFDAGGVSLIIIMLGQFIVVMLGPATNLLKSADDTKFIFYSYIMAATINILFNIVLVPKIGIMGAAIGTALATIVQTVFIFHRSKTHIDISLPLENYIRTVLSGMITAGLFSLIFSEIKSLSIFFVSIILFTFSYIFISLVNGSVKYKEIRSLVSFGTCI